MLRAIKENIMIIQTLLDTDLYKLTMLQAVVERLPANIETTYRFKCRNATEFPLAEIIDDVRREVEALCALRFTSDELSYLSTLRFISPGFIDYLEQYQLRERHLTIKADGENLSIEAHGPMAYAMYFEIFVLSIVNETYFRRLGGSSEEGRRRLDEKIALLDGVKDRATPFEFFDFGTRRRFSRDWHFEVVSTLKEKAPRWFKGTSNVDFARRLGLVPIGTMAHEWLQVFQAVGGPLPDFQKAALENWVQIYRGDLGIALTDVISMDAFLSDFDLYFAKLFDGLRHDSGDPIEWGEKALAHYTKLRVPVSGKRLVFSDGLTVQRAIEIYDYFGDRIHNGFGIGTNLSNDVGPKPLNIVMKVIEVNGQPVAKLSDSVGKTMCDSEAYVAYLREVFKC
jgi:nicotinate phosphoribosyltransferase